MPFQHPHFPVKPMFPMHGHPQPQHAAGMMQPVHFQSMMHSAPSTSTFASANTAVDSGEKQGPLFDGTPPPESSIDPKIIRGWADGMKARMDNVNALAVVATFLAAVQAQIISLTYEQNGSSLQQAVNAMSFLGLSFDIIGTAMGLISALTMQPDQQRLNQAVFEATAAHAEWRTFTRELEQIAYLDKGTGRSIPQNMMEETMRKQRDRSERRHLLEICRTKWIAEDEGRCAEIEDIRRVVVVGNVKGIAPLFLMALGIVSFFVSLLGFVIDTQPRVVWITTVVAVCGGGLILPVDALLHSRRAKAKLAKMQWKKSADVTPTPIEDASVEDEKVADVA